MKCIGEVIAQIVAVIGITIMSTVSVSALIWITFDSFQKNWFKDFYRRKKSNTSTNTVITITGIR
jgi:hypothetical protein